MRFLTLKPKINSMATATESQVQTESAKPPPPRAVTQVLDEIREEQKTTDTSHLDKLYALTDPYPRLFSATDKEELQQLGFHAFIKSQWISRFKYHANIFTSAKVNEGVRLKYVMSDGAENWQLGDAVNYAGDIPDTVLDKALSVRSIISQITVHSLQPFPVEFVKCDPVMIGWISTPRIQVDKKGTFDKIWRDNVEGVIISIWDYDTEVPVLG